MDAFRWILVTLALLIVVGIWLWSRNRRASRDDAPVDRNDPLGLAARRGTDEEDDLLLQRELRNLSGLLAEEREERQGRAERAVSVEDDEEGVVGPVRILSSAPRPAAVAPEAPVAPRRIDPESAPAAEPPPQEAKAPEVEPVLQSSSMVVEEVDDEPSLGTTGPADDDEIQVIALYLLARNGERLLGVDIASAAQSAGLRHGEMKIFHGQPANAAGDRRARFSLANMVEPGYFEIDSIDMVQTSGLVLFMQLFLPAPEQRVGPGDVFEAMVKAGRRMAVELGAELCDETRSLLTAQAERHLRDRIGEYVLRAELARRREGRR